MATAMKDNKKGKNTKEDESSRKKAAVWLFLHKLSKKKAIIGACVLALVLVIIGGVCMGVAKHSQKTAQTTQSDRNTDDTTDDSVRKNKPESSQESSTQSTSETLASKDSATPSGDSPASDRKSDGNTSASDTGSGKQQSKTDPAHTHTWKDHVVNTQVWVSKWVDVPDYKEERTPVGTKYTFSADGYVTTNDADAQAHAYQLVLNGQDSYYTDETVYDTKTVQVGSHKEDQGHYETKTVVDFTYCTTCGAVKGRQ